MQKISNKKLETEHDLLRRSTCPSGFKNMFVLSTSCNKFSLAVHVFKNRVTKNTQLFKTLTLKLS